MNHKILKSDGEWWSEWRRTKKKNRTGRLVIWCMQTRNLSPGRVSARRNTPKLPRATRRGPLTYRRKCKKSPRLCLPYHRAPCTSLETEFLHIFGRGCWGCGGVKSEGGGEVRDLVRWKKSAVVCLQGVVDYEIRGKTIMTAPHFQRRFPPPHIQHAYTRAADTFRTVSRRRGCFLRTTPWQSKAPELLE